MVMGTIIPFRRKNYLPNNDKNRLEIIRKEIEIIFDFSSKKYAFHLLRPTDNILKLPANHKAPLSQQ